MIHNMTASTDALPLPVQMMCTSYVLLRPFDYDDASKFIEHACTAVRAFHWTRRATGRSRALTSICSSTTTYCACLRLLGGEKYRSSPRYSCAETGRSQQSARGSLVLEYIHLSDRATAILYSCPNYSDEQTTTRLCASVVPSLSLLRWPSVYYSERVDAVTVAVAA